MKIYRLTLNSWQWPILFHSEEAAKEHMIDQFRYLFSAQRYYLSEPYRYRTWAGVPSVRYKLVDRHADGICPGFSRAEFTVQELTQEQLLQQDKDQRERSFELLEMKSKPECTSLSVERGPSSRR